ncbi:MAG: glycosyltransferase family 4 protein [Parvularculaceae bacterium]
MFAVPTLYSGGAERVISILANFWAASGREISIATFETPASTSYYQIDDRVRIHRLDLTPVSKPRWRAILHTFKRIGALRRLIRAERPDVIISFLTKMNVMTAQAADGLGVPVIISERNNPYLQKFDTFWDLSRAIAFPKAFAFVTMTRGAAEFFPENQRPHTRIIPNPVSPISIAPKSHRGYNLTAVGRLTEQKRFDRLIEAFSIIEKDFPDWRLVIWGEGDLRQKLEALRDTLGLKERISFPGVTKRHGGWVETADLFTLSSDYEGWANVLVEALACGIPIVSVDCDFGPKDILKGGELGVLAPRDDVAAYASALARMMSNEALRRDYAAKGVEDAKRYLPAAMAAEWDLLIDEALAAKA